MIAALDGAPLAVSLELLVPAVILVLGNATRVAFYLAKEDGKTLHHVVGMGEDYARAVDLRRQARIPGLRPRDPPRRSRGHRGRSAGPDVGTLDLARGSIRLSRLLELPAPLHDRQLRRQLRRLLPEAAPAHATGGGLHFARHAGRSDHHRAAAGMGSGKGGLAWRAVVRGTARVKAR